MKNKRSLLIKISAVAACVCLVLGGGFLIMRFLDKGNQPIITYTDNGIKMELILNSMSEPQFSVDRDIKIEQLPDRTDLDSSWQGFAHEFEKNVGVDFESFEERISAVMPEKTNAYTVLEASYKNNGEYVLHDYVFELELGGEVSAEIRVCGDKAPLRDWVIESDPCESMVGDVPVIISRAGETYLARFSLNGAYYDIETNNAEFTVMEKLLAALIEDN